MNKLLGIKVLQWSNIFCQL